ncbi:hypothetical protein BC830DRAFT_442209 [Chytriomyces sp. MP71]|nr:hypothetical protein BC830DRAFT_442209 [Chytriomyces sp. MP71]
MRSNSFLKMLKLKATREDGFVVGVPGLWEGGGTITVEGIVQFSWSSLGGGGVGGGVSGGGGADRDRPPYIEHLSVSLEGFVKAPREKAQVAPVTPLVQLSQTLVEKGVNVGSGQVRLNPPIDNPTVLRIGNHSSQTTVTMAPKLSVPRKPTASVSSPNLSATSASSADRRPPPRSIEVPFCFTLDQETLARMPPSIQLSPSGPANGSPYGLKYLLKAGCLYSLDADATHNHLSSNHHNHLHNFNYNPPSRGFSVASSVSSTVPFANPSASFGSSRKGSLSSEGAAVITSLQEAGFALNGTSGSSGGSSGYSTATNAPLLPAAATTNSPPHASSSSSISHSNQTHNQPQLHQSDRFKLLTDTRTIPWPHMSERTLLAVMKHDLLLAWNHAARTAATAAAATAIPSPPSDTPSAPPSTLLDLYDPWSLLRNPAAPPSALDEDPVRAFHAAAIAHLVLAAGAGNPVRRLGATRGPDVPFVAGSGQRRVHVVGAGGWIGAVEFESDTLCLGDRRDVKFRILEPVVGSGRAEVGSIEAAGTVKVRRGTAQFEPRD